MARSHTGTKPPATTISSSDGSHRAALTPSPDGDGVWVVIERVIPPPRTRLGAWFLRAPFHVALTRVHDIVYPLTSEGELRLAYDHDLGRVVLARSK